MEKKVVEKVIEKVIEKSKITLTESIFDRKEDSYAYQHFGKIVNRYNFSNEIYSDDFWIYLKDKCLLKRENIIVYCDFNTDVKNRLDKFYRYIITIDKPFKIVVQFYDEEKVVDERYYETEEEQKNKVTGLSVYFESENVELVDEMFDDISKFIYQPPMDKTFFIISTSPGGYELRPATIKEFDVKINLNYGDDFVDKYENIVDKLRNNKHGLFIFHGETGTGKTTLIRKLVSDLAEDKIIIYVPSYFMFDIANPDLISFISQFKNSILLLEDAEMILSSTGEERNQAISNILNISDGLLNDHMDMQIIATFNATREIMDKALLRKGRLMVNYKFDKLSAEDATKLSAYIGLNKKYNEAKTLAEIYEEKGGKQLINTESKTKKLGFEFPKKD